MTDQFSHSSDTASNDALVHRLFDLARDPTGDSGPDQGELARVDAMVYERLLETYGCDDMHCDDMAPAAAC